MLSLIISIYKTFCALNKTVQIFKNKFNHINRSVMGCHTTFYLINYTMAQRDELTHLYSLSSNIPEIQQPVEYVGSKVGTRGAAAPRARPHNEAEECFFFIFYGDDKVTISQSQLSFNRTRVSLLLLINRSVRFRFFLASLLPLNSLICKPG